MKKIIMCLIVFLFLVQISEANNNITWLDSAYKQKIPISINYIGSDDISNFFHVNVTLDGSQYNLQGLQITDSDNATYFPSWNETQLSSSTKVWINVSGITNTSTKTIWAYINGTYGVYRDEKTFIVFDKPERGPWTDKAPLPENLADLTSVVHNNKIYIFGGYELSSGYTNNDTYVYDPVNDTWQILSPMPTPRWGCIAVKLGTKAYVFGGQLADGNTTNVTEVYDLENDTWSTASPVPDVIASQGLTGVAYQDRIFLSRGTYLYAYFPANDTYVQLASVPQGSSWETAAIVNDKLYIIGGYAYGNKTRIYDITTNTWSLGADMPDWLFGAVRENPVINGKIYISHAQRSNPLGEFPISLYVYDPANNTWTSMTPPAHPRDGVTGGVVNDKLYVIGGRWETTVGTIFNEEYDPAYEGITVLNPAYWDIDQNVAYSSNGTVLTIGGGFIDGTTNKWIFDNSSTPYKIVWKKNITINKYIVEWQSSIRTSYDSQMGQAGVALINNTGKIVAFIYHEDEVGSLQQIRYRYLLEANHPAGTIVSGNSDYKYFRIIVNNSLVTLQYKATNNDPWTTLDSNTVFFKPDRVAILIGVYGNYPFIDYVNIYNLRVLRYTDVPPTITVNYNDIRYGGVKIAKNVTNWVGTNGLIDYGTVQPNEFLNMYIKPQVDIIKVWNVTNTTTGWSVTISSAFANNPVTFNISTNKPTTDFNIYRNGSLYATVTTDQNGWLNWTYYGGFSTWVFTFEVATTTTTTPTPTPTPSITPISSPISNDIITSIGTQILIIAVISEYLSRKFGLNIKSRALIVSLAVIATAIGLVRLF